ncbi:hypothetical protein AKJ64_02665 [candidate division MSBL1 archaeon SCGC-AAA259E17]|uniref:Amidohydrolase-related domain-containing protein n=1 Tax=candidate division MSBL1 archaeon SCGC-AAA259E17 TaxID=1698263 RepID=A0A133UEP5_9EURY|nr:hypothetical protein AKJ64_02665 [candidate division MSBL1 archaeon SCGC-AAA259E17]
MFDDCHWHPTEHEDDRLEEKISEAKDREVEEIIGVPLGVRSCEELLDISEWFESLHPAVGIQPPVYYIPMSSSVVSPKRGNDWIRRRGRKSIKRC